MVAFVFFQVVASVISLEQNKTKQKGQGFHLLVPDKHRVKKSQIQLVRKIEWGIVEPSNGYVSTLAGPARTSLRSMCVSLSYMYLYLV